MLDEGLDQFRSAQLPGIGSSTHIKGLRINENSCESCHRKRHPRLNKSVFIVKTALVLGILGDLQPTTKDDDHD